MFSMGPEREPEPDVIGTAPVDRNRSRGRWRRYVMGGGTLVLAGIIAAISLSSRGHQAAVPRPRTSPSVFEPVVPIAVPSQAWVVSLNIAIWPMPGIGQGLYSSMFAGGVAGNQGWELTVRDVGRPGGQCVAEVVLDDEDPHPIPARPALHTPVGDLTLMALGDRSPGVGVGFLQVAAPAAQVWLDPARIGGLEVSVPVVTVTTCGRQYYLAGFAYPLAGTLDVKVTRNGASATHYLVPTRLSRPAVPRVWEGVGRTSLWHADGEVRGYRGEVADAQRHRAVVGA
jgi:hypothetical protein